MQGPVAAAAEGLTSTKSRCKTIKSILGELSVHTSAPKKGGVGSQSFNTGNGGDKTETHQV